MPFVFATNVALPAIRHRDEQQRFNAFVRARRGQVWLHSTVWLELQVGARVKEEQNALESFVEPFLEVERVLVPSQAAWPHAGRVLARLADDHGIDVRRSSIHHDALIAASAREAGFTVVTNDLSDFEIIAPYLSKLSFAAPYP